MPSTPLHRAVPMTRPSRQRHFWLMTPLLIALAALLTVPFPAHSASGYSVEAGRILDPSGQPIQLRGVNHFGFNADVLQPQYLWTMGWKEQIAQIKELGFNAVRLPFVPHTLYSDQTAEELSYVEPNKNADLIGKTPLEMLDMWMAEANRQGLYVMLDFHSVTNQRLYPTWFVDDPADFGLTYNDQAYSEDDWVRDLRFVAERYAHLPYFFAIDLYNEPNGIVRWSTGDTNMADPKYFWKRAAEKAAAGVLDANPELLVFVQGINGNYDGIEDSSIPMNWGESFQQQAYQPLDIPYDKLVLSPHTYGPDVFPKPTFDDPSYPDNLARDWEVLFGQFSPTHPVIISEWGGRYGERGVGEADVVWQNAFVDYLLSKDIHSSFYWTYTPNSGDTGGILRDDLTVRQDKMELLQRHWGDVQPSSAAEPAPVERPTAPAADGDGSTAGGAFAPSWLMLLAVLAMRRAARSSRDAVSTAA